MKNLTKNLGLFIFSVFVIQGCNLLKTEDDKIKDALIGKYYQEDDHRSIPTIAKYDGMRFLFKEHKFSFDALLSPTYQPRKEIIAYYNNLSKKLKYKMQVPPAMLEACYQEYDDVKDLKRKNEVLELYKEYYPEKVEKFITSLKK